jgi:hypothetical protein
MPPALHILTMSMDYPESLVGLYREDRSPDPYALCVGKRYPEPAAVAHLRFKRPAAAVSKRNLPEHGGAGVPLVSPRLASLLQERCPADIQLLEARVLAGGAALRGYRLVNLLRKESVVDRTRSDVVHIHGTEAILKFNKLRFSRTDLGGRHIARVKEWNPMIVVSDVLREEILELGLSGWAFIRGEDVRP